MFDGRLPLDMIDFLTYWLEPNKPSLFKVESADSLLGQDWHLNYFMKVVVYYPSYHYLHSFAFIIVIHNLR